MNLKTMTILECSRVFSLPMTVFSWLVVFVYGVVNSGNVIYGIVAFIGLSFAHLATNLLDDYIDYKFLIKQVNFDKEQYLIQTQKTKCRYIINGTVSEKQILTIVLVYLVLAFLSGLFLFFKCGSGVLIYALIGAFCVLLYPFLSRICLSEIAVAIAYGPALFGGVYYVMTGTCSYDVYLLALPTMFMTVVLLYIHTVMDYDYDINEDKKTIANCFDSQLNSLVVLKIILIISYLSLILLCVFDILDWQVFLTCLTIPLAVDLYKSLESFSLNPEKVPERKWYHFPMEGLSRFNQEGEKAFMIRMFQSRNLMIYFSIFIVLAILLSIGL